MSPHIMHHQSPAPHQHPAYDLLAAYAAGTLGEARRLVLAAHLSACPACRREIALAEAVGGVLLAELPPAAMALDALDRALARIERPAADPVFSEVPDRPDWIKVPAEVLQAARRRRWAAPGVWVAPVMGPRKGARSYLLGIGAGVGVPRHTHRGSEMICVLKGAYVDRGITHGPGDFIENDESVEHTSQVTADGECVCLVAADGLLIPKDWVGRLFQPLVGI